MENERINSLYDSLRARIGQREEAELEDWIDRCGALQPVSWLLDHVIAAQDWRLLMRFVDALTWLALLAMRRTPTGWLSALEKEKGKTTLQ
jgi:hypothetical protein